MTWRRPQDNYPCECGSVARNAENTDHPLQFDPVLEEYYLRYGNGDDEVRQVVYFCLFCGGKLPASKRGSQKR